MNACVMCRRLDSISSDRELIGELATGWVVLSDSQGSRGWCVLLLKGHLEHLGELPAAEQGRVFADVARVAAAIRSVFPDTGKDGGPPRINYECLGNLVPHIHWHVIPRHADDPDPTRTVWTWTETQLKGDMTAEQRTELIGKLRAALREG